MNINKIITILLLSVLSLSLSAQKKTPTKKNTQTQTEIPAYETIEYTNGVIDFNNRQTKLLKRDE